MFLTLDEVLKKHDQKLLKLNLLFLVLISIYSGNTVPVKLNCLLTFEFVVSLQMNIMNDSPDYNTDFTTCM